MFICLQTLHFIFWPIPNFLKIWKCATNQQIISSNQYFSIPSFVLVVSFFLCTFWRTLFCLLNDCNFTECFNSLFLNKWLKLWLWNPTWLFWVMLQCRWCWFEITHSFSSKCMSLSAKPTLVAFWITTLLSFPLKKYQDRIFTSNQPSPSSCHNSMILDVSWVAVVEFRLCLSRIAKKNLSLQISTPNPQIICLCHLILPFWVHPFPSPHLFLHLLKNLFIVPFFVWACRVTLMVVPESPPSCLFMNILTCLPFRSNFILTVFFCFLFFFFFLQDKRKGTKHSCHHLNCHK